MANRLSPISHWSFKTISIVLYMPLISTTIEENINFQDNYRVSNLCHNDDKIVVRLVTDNPPENHKITIANPTLEDLYLYVFEQGM